jgi:hypothetical protein
MRSSQLTIRASSLPSSSAVARWIASKGAKLGRQQLGCEDPVADPDRLEAGKHLVPALRRGSAEGKQRASTAARASALATSGRRRRR